VGADRGGPLGCSGPRVCTGGQAGTTVGMEHKVVSIGVAAEHKSTSMFGCSLGRSTAASRASNSMRAIGVRGQAWPIATALNGNGCNNFPTQSMHGQIRTQRHCAGKLDMRRAAGVGHLNALLTLDV
jgi:hypothetical protein